MNVPLQVRIARGGCRKWLVALLAMLGVASLMPEAAVAAPLDSMSGVVAAFSLRRLRTAYSGPAIQVRRTSDNAVMDIGFNASGDLDTTTLASFVGANSGYVAVWYDQSGQGNNATQSTTSAQPIIVSAGTTLSRNGRASMLSTSVSQFLYVTTGSILGSNGTTTAENFVNSVAYLDSNTGHVIISNDSPGLYGHGIGNSSYGSAEYLSMYDRGFGFGGSGTFPLSQLLIVETNFSTTTGNMGWVNGSLVWNSANDTGNGGSSQATIFDCQPASTGYACSGSGNKYISEIIVTKGMAITTSARTYLERDQNAYYAITGSIPGKSVSLIISTQTSPISDPVNGTTNAKYIPQSIFQVKFNLQSNTDSADSNSLSTTFAIDGNTDVYSGNLQSGKPWLFTDGTPSCGLTPSTYAFLDSGGNTINPTADAAGYVSSVAKMKIVFSGQLSPNLGTAPNCSIAIQQRTR